MFRRYFLPFLASIAFILSTTLLASAQNGQLRGQVTLKQSDGKIVPAADAVVDVFRWDLPGDFPLKTNKKGEFVHAGLPIQGTYVVSVSMPGAQPYYLPGVRPGREEPVKIELATGDGKRLTRDEIKALIAKAPGTSAGDSKSSAEDKAKRAELEARNREITEKNKKAEDSNKIIGEKFKFGNTSLAAAEALNKGGKYAEAEPLFTTAIAQYDEGIAADPEHPGAPTLMTNKAQALMDRAVARYNSAISSESYKTATKAGGAEASAMLDPARKDWKDAAESATKAVGLFKAQPAPTDATDLANYNRSKYSALFVRTEALNKVVTKVDPTQVDAGVAAYDEYLAAESDAAKKAKAERDMAKMLFEANAYDKAKAAYDKILAQNPDDVDALQNVGLILYNLGFVKESEGKKDEAKAQYQEAANYLQRFVDKAPDGQNKTDAQDILKNMKENQNVQAEKTSTPTRRRRP